MSCYLRHFQEILDEAGVKVDPGNRKKIDEALHRIAGVDQKHCPTAWRALKPMLSDDKGRRELVQKLKAALR